MNPISKVALGKTQVHVTRLGLGGSGLGGLYQDISDQTAIGLVHRTLELGINFIDTAPLYGHGKSEMRLRSALKAVPRQSYVLAIKCHNIVRAQKCHNIVESDKPRIVQGQRREPVGRLELALNNAKLS